MRCRHKVWETLPVFEGLGNVIILVYVCSHTPICLISCVTFDPMMSLVTSLMHAITKLQVHRLYGQGFICKSFGTKLAKFDLWPLVSFTFNNARVWYSTRGFRGRFGTFIMTNMLVLFFSPLIYDLYPIPSYITEALHLMTIHTWTKLKVNRPLGLGLVRDKLFFLFTDIHTNRYKHCFWPDFQNGRATPCCYVTLLVPPIKSDQPTKFQFSTSRGEVGSKLKTNFQNISIGNSSSLYL